MANDSIYGLNASVFSGSVSRAARVAEQIDCGSVNINEGYRATFSSADAPMGGMKESGLGRRNGPEGFARFIESRTVARATGLLTLPRTGPEFARLDRPHAAAAAHPEGHPPPLDGAADQVLSASKGASAPAASFALR